MKTAVEFLFEEMNRIRLEVESENISALDFFNQQNEAFSKAKLMEQNGYQNLIDTFIKNREQTRPLFFENGFVKGFEEGMKHSEEFWNKLQETELDEEEFTREYLQEKSNQYLNSEGKNI